MGTRRDSDIFDRRVVEASALIEKLASRAEGLSDENRALFGEVLEELQTSLEELQVAGEELTQQAEELAAARLAEEEGRLRYLELFDRAPNAYFVTDASGLIVEANERAGTLLGADPAALLKKPLVLYIDRADRKAFFAHLDRLPASGRLENWEVFLRTKKGKKVSAEVDITPIPGPKGEAAGFRWLVRDVTEVRKREQEARLATFPELNPEPVLEADDSGHIYYINRAAKRAFPGLEEQGAGHPWLEGLAEAGAKLRRHGRKSLTQEIQVGDRWFLRTVWSVAGETRLRIYGKEITARKLAEESLRQARDYLDNLFDHANAPMMVWDTEARITRFNRAFEDLTGLAASEALGRDVAILFPEDRRKESLGLIRRAISEDERWETVEIPILRRDGTVRTVLWNSANIFDPAGRSVVATIAQGQDITERKLMEEALLEYQAELEDRVAERTAELARSSELLERMFASVDLAIAYIDKDLNFIRVNKAFADAFGGGPDDYRGRNVFARGPDAAGEAKFRKVLETGEAWAEFESAFPSALFPGREKAYWDWNLQRVSPGGEAEGLILSLVDVSQRVKAEEERRRLATAVRQSTEGIVITDKADRIVFANQSFQTLHGLDRKDLLGRAYGDILLFDREADAFRDELRQVKERGEVWKARLTRTLGGRADTKLDITISPVRDPSGEIVNFAVLERDMTNEHRLEASVRQLQKFDALGTLAGGVAHDFNNILVPIFINAEMAAFDAEKGSPLSRYLSLILEAANRGRELIKQIIAFSRPSEPKRALVDIVPVVKEALQFLRSSIPRTVTIRERFGAASGLVRADPTQIHQIIMNLGSNAAYAMRDSGGELDLGLSEVVITPGQAAQSPDLHPGPYVRLTVADTGPGMTKEIAERIFDPFFTTKRRGEGAGMGLPVVLGIVRGHDGTITVATEPGRGTTFEVLIPKASGRVAPSRAAARLLPIGPGRVLFVDDEDMLVRTVAAMLERLGLTVTAASDPVEALEIFRKSPGEFDLVITDQAMPGLTGDKLAREMLRLRPDLPIILSTGFSETIREEEAQAIGIRDFVMKPFSTAEISDKIRAALKKA